MLASTLAYSAFFAIPATLLVIVGVFSLVADPALIARLMDHFAAIAPAQAVTLLRQSLLQLERQPSAGIVMTVVGFLLALWSTTGAAGTLMTGINRARERRDPRSFAMRRLAALAVVFCLGISALLLTVFLVLGPHVERWIGGAVGAKSLVSWVWWTAQWPILLVVLLGAFSAVFALASDPAHRRWRFVSPGGVIALFGWLASSALFALYASRFGSYNKTWGSLSVAIVTLTWLWLSALSLLFGAEVDAEIERSRTNGREIPPR